MIQLSDVTVVGANPSVLSWPVKARLDSIGIVPNKMQIRTTGTGHWQAVPIDDTGMPAQSGTLWVFEQIGGKWYASGAERLRPSQLNGDKPVADPSAGGLSTLLGNGWLFDGRWGAMGGHNPKPGDTVGFMIASGSTRLDMNSREQERTDVIECRWPDVAGKIPFDEVWREGSAEPQQPDRPADPPVSQPEQPSDYAAAIARLQAQVAALEGANTTTNEKFDAKAKAQEARIASLEVKPDVVPATPTAYVKVFGARIPVTFE